jgi:hypothetical protein
MSGAIRTRSAWVGPISSKAAGVVPNTAAVEVALRIAVGAMGVEVLTGVVRRHPLLSLLLASGIGYVFGNGWGRRGPTPAAGTPKNR